MRPLLAAALIITATADVHNVDGPDVLDLHGAGDDRRGRGGVERMTPPWRPKAGHHDRK